MEKDKFQARYQVHEYPGRKPWYIVRRYIDKYSNPGEIILDPFCGSGVVPCEALIARRRVIALDIDPLAVFISKMTCISPVDLERLQGDFSQIEDAAKDTIYSLYELDDGCPLCAGRLIMSSAARMLDVQKVNIRAFCMDCGKFHDLVFDLEDWENNTDEPVPYWYPKNVELPEGIRGNIRYLHELYTNRNLQALSILWHNINLVRDEICGKLLMLCFSATLSKASRINVPKISGKGWTAADYNVYNIPDNFLEFNVWDGFSNKFASCLGAKTQTNQLIGDFYASEGVCRILKASADDLAFVFTDSIDYILTDPPYADVIRYYERSFVRNAWLGFENEYSPEDYQAMMQKSLREMHRVLRPGRYMSILLKGTSQQFQDRFVELAEDAGFKYEKTDLENLGYVESVDHVLSFVASDSE